jgi:acyl carrier protein
MRITQFVIEIENKFEIEFSDEELAHPAFKIVGGLIKMIKEKMNNK